MNLLVQYSIETTLVESIVVATMYVIICYPVTFYLSNVLMIRSLREKKAGRFVVYFLLCSLLLGTGLWLVTNFVIYLESTDLF